VTSRDDGVTSQDGAVTSVEFILYVSDQARARDFWAATLAAEPTLDVPGMTEFDLGGATLGLMPERGIESLFGESGLRVGAGQRCEVYLRRWDAAALVERALGAGARQLAAIEPRDWGEDVGYLLDPDGHVLAVAVAPPRA